MHWYWLDCYCITFYTLVHMCLLASAHVTNMATDNANCNLGITTTATTLLCIILLLWIATVLYTVDYCKCCGPLQIMGVIIGQGLRLLIFCKSVLQWLTHAPWRGLNHTLISPLHHHFSPTKPNSKMIVRASFINENTDTGFSPIANSQLWSQRLMYICEKQWIMMAFINHRPLIFSCFFSRL